VRKDAQMLRSGVIRISSSSQWGTTWTLGEKSKVTFLKIRIVHRMQHSTANNFVEDRLVLSYIILEKGKSQDFACFCAIFALFLRDALFFLSSRVLKELSLIDYES
jgi:hypothetical protein